MSKCATRKRKIIFILIALIVMLLTFKFGYLGAVVPTGELNAESLELRGELAKLNEYVEKQDDYLNEIREITQNKNQIIEKYGVGVTPEKISLFMHEVGLRTGAQINDISFGEKLLADFEKERNIQVDKSKAGGVFFYKTPITINMEVDYKELKGVITLIQSGTERMNIESIKATSEDGGKLYTTVVLNAYEISGTDKKYEAPKIDVPIGNESPLGEIKTEKVRDNVGR